jgi:hypothetical protein
MKSNNKVGRPSKFDPKMLEQVEKLCMLGATDKEMADFFEVSEQTFYTWKHEHPEFLEALRNGKEEADANVASRLYARAIGYEHDDVHISNYQGVVTQTPIRKHYPPDTAAAIIWLKNRQPKRWRDKIDHQVSGEIEHKHTLDVKELARRVAFTLQSGAREIEDAEILDQPKLPEKA